MKIIPNILFVSLVCGALLSSVSCRKDFEELNQPYKDAGEGTATIPGLFNGMVSSLGKYGDDVLNVGVLYPTANQQAFQNIATPFINYAGTYWSQYYPDLVTYRALLQKIGEQSDPASFNNVKYMATILLASKTLRMLDYYGDIPYSQASMAKEGSENFRPAYDAAPDVYKSVLDDLKEAADGLSDDASQVSIGASESYLGGWNKVQSMLRSFRVFHTLAFISKLFYFRLNRRGNGGGATSRSFLYFEISKSPLSSLGRNLNVAGASFMFVLT